ncbi:MAG TPA: NAD(P)/FAD-dependent oxidoreductase [Anaerolineales bacterium]|nr:NAD(P)/FAD-dependent oxidoreductase [Anaerolineales bacterium]
MTDGPTVAVIGGGVAGLTAGSYLARHGWSVKVFEAAPTPGGSSGDARADGFTFNDGAQYLLLPTMLDFVFSQLGVDRPRVLPLRPVHTSMSVVVDDGPPISVGPGAQLSCGDPRINLALAARELKRMIDTWHPLLRAYLDEDLWRGPFSFRRFLGRSWRYLPKFRRTLQAELAALFTDPVFRSAVAGLLLFAGAHPHDLPAPSIIALVSILTDGLALPEGGMGRIPVALKQALQASGGELFLDAQVRRIVLRDGRVRGVDVEGLGQLEASYVLSTATALTTFKTLVPTEAQPRRLRNKVKETPLSAKAFSIQLGLSNVISTDSHLTHIVPSMERLDDYFSPPRDGVTWGYYSVPTVTLPELAPEGGSVVEIYPAIRSDEPVEAWDEDRTRRLADAAIEWLSKRHHLDIATRRIRSPRDFQEQLRLPQGAIYGVSPAGGAQALFGHRSPIPGLFLAGQTTLPGFGVAPSALSGIICAQTMMSNPRP